MSCNAGSGQATGRSRARRGVRAAALGCLLALCSTLSVSPASAQSLADLKAKGKLTVGVVVDLAPFGLLDSAQQPAGLDIDVSRRIGACLNLPVDLVQVNGSNRIPFLLGGKVDLLASALAITPERAKQVLFSQPYVGLDNVLIGPRDMKLTSVADLAGHTVAVPRSSTQEVALVAQAPAGTRIQRYDDQATTLQALLSGQAETMGTPETILKQIDAAAPGRFEKKFSLFVQKNAIAARPGQTELITAVNGCIEPALRDGTFGAIYRKWFGTEMPAL